jgi:hypothetical protein
MLLLKFCNFLEVDELWGLSHILDSHGSVVVKAPCYTPEIAEFETRGGEWNFSIYLFRPAALGPGIHSASNINEYQNTTIMFLESIALLVCKADNITTICEPIV